MGRQLNVLLLLSALLTLGALAGPAGRSDSYGERLINSIPLHTNWKYPIATDATPVVCAVS